MLAREREFFERKRFCSSPFPSVHSFKMSSSSIGLCRRSLKHGPASEDATPACVAATSDGKGGNLKLRGIKPTALFLPALHNSRITGKPRRSHTSPWCPLSGLRTCRWESFPTIVPRAPDHTHRLASSSPSFTSSRRATSRSPRRVRRGPQQFSYKKHQQKTIWSNHRRPRKKRYGRIERHEVLQAGGVVMVPTRPTYGAIAYGRESWPRAE